MWSEVLIVYEYILVYGNYMVIIAIGIKDGCYYILILV